MTGAGRVLLDGAARADFATDAQVARWVAAHFDFIWRLLRRLGLSPADADDAAQHVFMIATQKLDSVPAGSERSFLYGTAVRVAANARRARGRRREHSTDQLDARASEALGPEQGVVLREARALLDDLLERLPDELRRVLVLADVEQLELAEIAALERLAIGTAASRLRRARAAFRAQLKRAERRNPFARRPP